MSAVAVNPAWPGLIASCSGQRNHSRRLSDNQPPNIDNTLKFWKYAGKITSHLDAGSEDFGPYPLPDEVAPDIDSPEAAALGDTKTTAQGNIAGAMETESAVITKNQVAMNPVVTAEAIIESAV